MLSKAGTERLNQIKVNVHSDRFEFEVICFSLDSDRGNPVMDHHLYLPLYK